MTIKISNAFSILKEMRSLPEVTLRLYGTDDAKDFYTHFTKPHPRYKVIQNKKWGVALMPIPEEFNDYLKGEKKKMVRNNRPKCLKKGYQFQTFQPMDRISDIMAIHRSADYRQGRLMGGSYVNENRVLEWASDKPLLYGVFDSENILKAYIDLTLTREVCILDRITGHADSLNDGLMYLLFSEIVKLMVTKKSTSGFPDWIMYDTFFGA